MFKLAQTKSGQWVLALLSCYYGMAFFVAGVQGYQAMAPDEYGELAVSLEIEAMAGVQLSASLMVLLGLAFNGRWRWSALMRLCGGVVVMCLCGMLCWSAFQAPAGWPTGIYVSGFVGAWLWAGWHNLVDTRAALKWWPDGQAV